MDIVTLSTETIFWLSIAIFITSVISSATGMAGGVLMFACMSQAMAIQPLIAIHGLIQVFSNAARSLLLKRDIVWSMCWPFAIGAVIGTFATLWLLIQLISEGMALTVLLILLVYTLFKPKKLPDLTLPPKGYFFVGIATGCVGIIAGAIDPILGAFFVRNDLTKEQVVATKSIMQLIVHLLKVPAVVLLGFSISEHLDLILIFSLVAIIGTKSGVILLKKINIKVFFTVMKIALLGAALRISWQLIEMI